MRPSISFVAAVLGVASIAALSPATAQQQAPGQQQVPEKIQPQANIDEGKLDAAGTALGRVTAVRLAYQQKIATAPETDKNRLAGEASDAMKKVVADTGLSVEEYNSIIKTAQDDPGLRQQLVERAQRSAQ